MREPGPDHPITITPATTRWRAIFHNAVIADSAHALVLKEADYPPVVYFPKDDVSLEYAAKTDHTSHCPYKGDASYYTFRRDTEFAENVAWSYESPYPAMAQIAGHIAFYPDRVEVYAVDEDRVDPHHKDVPDEPRTVNREVDEAVQHTDSGAGVSQREHWPSNVEGPGPREGGLN